MGAEAVLLFTPQAKENFKFYRKQAMQLSSKTRFLAAQFYAYFKEDLYLEIARHTTSTARQLAGQLSEFPEIHLPYPTESNAVFAGESTSGRSPGRGSSSEIPRWVAKMVVERKKIRSRKDTSAVETSGISG